jgi:hypothetical protein
MDLRAIDWEDLDLINLIQSTAPAVRFCENGNEQSSSIECQEFF